MAGPDKNELHEFTITWADAEAHAVAAANAFLMQQSPHEFVLTLAFAVPPYPEDAATSKTIPAKVSARVALSPGRAVELLEVLQQALAQYQKTQKH